MVFWTNDPDTSPALAARPLIRWVRDPYAAPAPHSTEGAYINLMAANDQERGIQLRRPLRAAERHQEEVRCGQPVPGEPEYPRT